MTTAARPLLFTLPSRAGLARLAGLMAAGLVMLGPPAAAQPRDCIVPADLIGNEPPLVRTGRTLAAGGEVTILAIGGASTQGRAAGPIDLAWPARMAIALNKRFPAARIATVNRADPRQTAEDMLRRFDRDVLAAKPDLVIWETGTTDAVRNMDIYFFREVVQAGIDKLRQAGIEMVLMDMQFSRRSTAVINLDRYRDVLRELADVNDIPLFRRNELMRLWFETGVFDLNVTDSEKRRAMAARLYDCIGKGMAQLIAHGATAESLSPAAPAASSSPAPPPGGTGP